MSSAGSRGVFAALLLLPLTLSLSCDNYPWQASTGGFVTANSSWALDGALTVTGTLEITLTASETDTTFALDGLRFRFEGVLDSELEIESLDFEKSEWPVTVAAGTSEIRNVGFTLRKPAPELLPQECPTSIFFAVEIEVLADSEVYPSPITFSTVHTCEGCTANPGGVGIPVAWETQPANPFVAVKEIEVDATQAVWLLGQNADNSGLLAQSITPAGAGTAIQLSGFGEVAIGSGSLPGIILATRSETGFVGGFGSGGGDAGGDGGGGGEGGAGGAGGAGGSSSGPQPGAATVLISRYDSQGTQLWQRQLTGSDGTRTVAAFAGQVLVGVSSPSGLFADGELLDPAAGDYLVLMDEVTGEVIRYSAGFAAVAMVSTGEGAGVFGHPSDEVDLPELRLLDSELATLWSADMSANGITLFAELAAVGEVFFVYDPAAGLVYRRSADGSPEWESSVAFAATSLASLTDGGALLGGTGIAMRLDGQGVVTDLTRDEGEPSWCVGPFVEYAFASGGESPAFVFTDQSFLTLTVGRLVP